MLKSACGAPRGTGSDHDPQAVSQETCPFAGSYLIRVWGSVSLQGGPLLRRDGFTNTPCPGGQRK